MFILHAGLDPGLGGCETVLSTLGNILADPFSPHEPIAHLSPSASLPIKTTLETKVSTMRPSGPDQSDDRYIARLSPEQGGWNRHPDEFIINTPLRTTLFERTPNEDDVDDVIGKTPAAKRVLENWREFSGRGPSGKLFLVVDIVESKTVVLSEKDSGRGSGFLAFRVVVISTKGLERKKTSASAGSKCYRVNMLLGDDEEEDDDEMEMGRVTLMDLAESDGDWEGYAWYKCTTDSV